MHSALILSKFLNRNRVFAALATLLCATVAHAQFVQVGPFVNVGTDRHTLVIATEGDYPNTGLFIAYQDEPFDVQAVNPAQLDKSKSRSIFLVFNSKLNIFSELILQYGKSYAIRPGGSFSITFESSSKGAQSTRVSVANTANPYCSIVISRGKNPSILGYVGTQAVVNVASNDKAVALLEANQMLAMEEYKNVIFDFSLGKNGDLMLNGKPFAGESIGVAIPNENPCLRPGALWIDEEQIPKTESAEGKDEQLAKAIEKRPGLVSSIDDFLISNISPTFIAALNFKSGDFGVIKLRSSFAGKNYCVFGKVQAR